MSSRLTFQPGSHAYWLRNGDGKGRQRLPSVTTLLKQLDKPALTRWASNTAAEYAIDHWADLELLSPSERRKAIAAAPWASRDRAAASGTAIHAMAEHLLAGEPVEVPDSLTSKVEGLARWIEAAGIQVVASEVRVWTEPDDEFGLVGYAGTLDAFVKDPKRGLGIVDWKTGSGIYGETALQLAGYKTADFMVAEDADEPMMRVDWVGAVHVQAGFSELHTLTPDQVDAAVDRFHLLRLLANTVNPEFRLEVTG
jgi:hypothetical protein